MLSALIHDDAIFQSPAVHAPQRGKPLVLRYLMAATEILGPTIVYIGERHREHSAILEFEATIDGTYINGIDMIEWNDTGQIVLFKVMVRPIKALNMLVALMGERLVKAQAFIVCPHRRSSEAD